MAMNIERPIKALGEVATLTRAFAGTPDTVGGSNQQSSEPIIVHRVLIDAKLRADNVSVFVAALNRDNSEILEWIDSSDAYAPAAIFASSSVINPVLNTPMDRGTDKLVLKVGTQQLASTSGHDVGVYASLECVNPAATYGVEGARQAVQTGYLAAHRVLALGRQADGTAGTWSVSGKTDFAGIRRLQYLCIIAATSEPTLSLSARDDDCTVTTLKINQDDHVFDGAVGIAAFSEDRPAFSFGGAELDQTDTITLDVTSDNQPALCAGIVAQAG